MKNPVLILFIFLFSFTGCNQQIESPVKSGDDGNYDFKSYSELTGVSRMLPDPFLKSDGTSISSLAEWNTQREYIKQMLEFYVYGPRPDFKIQKTVQLSQNEDFSVSSNALTTFYEIYYDTERFFTIRITRPSVDKKYPVMMRYESDMNFRFPIEKDVISDELYIIVAINHLDISPDNRPLSQSHMQENEAKAIMAWAYGATLTIDFLSTLDYTDMDKIAITGHSRTGKAALCAAAYDERIALVVPNSSGSAGASGLRNFGEKGTQAVDIAEHQPSWVSDNLTPFIKNQDKLPLDMHFARALVAPRPILCTESKDGDESLWAGPRSTYVMWAAADEVYKMYGTDSVNNNLINMRAGQHDQLGIDYQMFLSFCNFHFYGGEFDTELYRDGSYYSEAGTHFDFTMPFVTDMP